MRMTAIAPRLLLVGGGKMGSALLGGLLESGVFALDELAVVEIREDGRAALAAQFSGLTVVAEPVAAEAAIVAVKPADLATACTSLASLGIARVLSIVAGAPIATLEQLLGPEVAVVRAMPNTPALLRAGASAIAAGTTAGDVDLAWATMILQAVGVVVTVPERLLDAVTGLSGSGPAYLFLVAEALVEAGVLAGLDRPTSRLLTTQTLLGSARLLAETAATAEQLRGEVTSPGGTTAAGLRVLEQRAVRAAFLDAVAAAAQRSRELGAPS
jgi:pyrroline-5-carboxylate reductase